MRPIDADALKKAIELLCEDERTNMTAIAYFALLELVDTMPTIEAESVKRGKWENDKLDIPRCSCCSYIPEFNRHIDDYYYSDFCPNCGARMDGESNG